MTINVLALVVIIILAGLAWWANEQLNTIPKLSQIIRVLIVIVAVLMVLQSLGLISALNSTVRIG